MSATTRPANETSPASAPTDAPNAAMPKATAWAMIKRTVNDWLDDHAPAQAASLAYYTLFSIAPLLIIAVGVAGLIFGQETVRNEVVAQLHGLFGADSARIIEDMMVTAGKDASGGVAATVLGALLLMFAATSVFAQLQDTLNAIWKVKAKPMNGAVAFLRQRFLSASMVLGIGFLLLVSLLLSTALSAVGKYLGHRFAGWDILWQGVNQLVSLGVITALFAMIYKILPDTEVRWKDVWLGAFVTSALFAIGKLLIGLYLARASVASSYGAAGSFAVILIWVYYSSQILFLGAEFTHVYAVCRGGHVDGQEAKEAEAKDTNTQKPASDDSAKTLPLGRLAT